MKCDIILLVWNQYELTKKCIESIYDNTEVDSRLIIVDNASDDEKVQQYLKSIRPAGHIDVRLIRNEKNEGFVGGMNVGIAACEAPFVCLLNNDTIVTRGWLREMIFIAQTREKIGVVNPASNNFGIVPQMGEDIHALALRRKARQGTFMEVGSCVGFCMLIKRAVLAELGGLNREVNGFFFEDTDYSKRAIEAGFTCVIAHGSYVFHREHSSVNKMGSRKEKLFKQNQRWFNRKWGRPLRVAVFQYKIPVSSEGFKSVLEKCVWLGRKGSFIQIYANDMRDIKRRDLFDMHNMPEHGNIQLFLKNVRNFTLFSVLRVLKKRKKKFDIVITDNEKVAGILKALGLFHSACVLLEPDMKRIEETWKKKSQSR